MLRKNSLFVIGLIIIFLSIVFVNPVMAQKLKLVLGHEHTAIGVDHICNLKFAEKVKELTNGEVEIAVHPGGALGKEKYMMEQLQRGALDMSLVGIQMLELWVGPTKALVLPGVFKDLEHITKALSPGSPLFKKWDELIMPQGFKTLAFGGHMFKNFLMRKKALYTLEDIQGLKIRQPESPIMLETTRALGASAVPIPWGELYTALQLGTVDGAGVSPPNTRTMKFYEICDVLSLYPLFPMSHVLLYSKPKWDKLDPKYRKAITEAAPVWSQVFNEGTEGQMGYVAYAKAGIRDLVEKGMTVNAVHEREAYDERVMKVTQKYMKEDKGVKELVDIIRSLQ